MRSRLAPQGWAVRGLASKLARIEPPPRPLLPGASLLLEPLDEVLAIAGHGHFRGHLHPLEHLRMNIDKLFSVSRSSLVPELNPLVKDFLLESDQAEVWVKKP